MKFKLIGSMAHNWTHSFMSGMNWVEGDYVSEDMHKLARERRGEKVVITWLPERQPEPFALTPRIRESLKHYRKACFSGSLPLGAASAFGLPTSSVSVMASMLSIGAMLISMGRLLK